MDIPFTTNFLSSSIASINTSIKTEFKKSKPSNNVNIKVKSKTIDTKCSSLFKTEICRSFHDYGRCKYGSKCQFAHNLNELREINRHPRYKTQYCKTFQEKGSCPYGSRCCFIHENCNTLLHDDIFSKSMVLPVEIKIPQNVYSLSFDSRTSHPHFKKVTDFSSFLDRTPGHPIELTEDKENIFLSNEIIDASNLLPTDVMFLLE